MDTLVAGGGLQKKMTELFEENRRTNFRDDSKLISELRVEAMESFRRLGFPTQKEEAWRSTNISPSLMLEYVQHFKPFENSVDIEKIFQCDIYDLDTYVVSQLNGWYNFKSTPLTQLPDGTIIGSFSHALREYPELVEKHFAKYNPFISNGMDALNTAFAQDGVFIYVPDGVRVEKPVQIINLINLFENIFVQPRNLIILGKNSHLQIAHCDHSLKHKTSLINSVTEIYMGENSHLDHYKIQNKDNLSTLITSTDIHQEANSSLTSSILSLHGGLIRNNLRTCLAGENASANLSGLYLVDNEQHIDNNIFVDHAKPNCYSNELFKGILDDQARAVFKGHVLVRKDAQKTNAFQNNRNILLTDKARVNTKPHLEIYADDVKCSHGATVGQLDPDAMFYMRSRGIGYDQARMLLMNAFASEVIDNIKIEPLRERIDELVSKRLRGELSICDQCIVDCREKRPVVFDIDLSKV